MCQSQQKVWIISEDPFVNSWYMGNPRLVVRWATITHKLGKAEEISTCSMIIHDCSTLPVHMYIRQLLTKTVEKYSWQAFAIRSIFEKTLGTNWNSFITFKLSWYIIIFGEGDNMFYNIDNQWSFWIRFM